MRQTLKFRGRWWYDDPNAVGKSGRDNPRRIQVEEFGQVKRRQQWIVRISGRSVQNVHQMLYVADVLIVARVQAYLVVHVDRVLVLTIILLLLLFYNVRVCQKVNFSKTICVKTNHVIIQQTKKLKYLQKFHQTESENYQISVIVVK